MCQLSASALQQPSLVSMPCDVLVAWPGMRSSKEDLQYTFSPIFRNCITATCQYTIVASFSIYLLRHPTQSGLEALCHPVLDVNLPALELSCQDSCREPNTNLDALQSRVDMDWLSPPITSFSRKGRALYENSGSNSVDRSVQYSAPRRRCAIVCE